MISVMPTPLADPKGRWRFAVSARAAGALGDRRGGTASRGESARAVRREHAAVDHEGERRHVEDTMRAVTREQAWWW